MCRSKTEGGRRCPGNGNQGWSEASAAVAVPVAGAGEHRSDPAAEASAAVPPRGHVTVAPGHYRPRGALGPLIDGNGEVVASNEWPHAFNGQAGMTREQAVYVEQVKAEG